MLTRKEMCQIFLMKAQQKFGKNMSELDIYYAGPEVGISLYCLGLLQDQSSVEYIKSAPCTFFKHPNGKELTYIEFLSLLPDPNPSVLDEKPKQQPKSQNITEEQIKSILGDRKYYRVCDVVETLQLEDLAIVAQFLKLKFDELQSPAT
jgi:hypothetical protein